MTIVPINKETQNLTRILYESAFPVDERRSWDKVTRLLCEGKFRFYNIFEKNVFSGIISVWKFKEFIYLEHFAIETVYRSKGLGTKVIEKIKTYYSLPLVLEVEVPNNDIAIKRINFYKRLGFSLLTNSYIQPPYSKKQNPLEMKIMTTNDYLDFDKIKKGLYSNVYMYPNFVPQK